MYWCGKRRKIWRNWILCKMNYCFLLMVLWMVKTLNIFHQLFEQWSPIRHEVAFHFYGTCMYLCHLFFVIWKCFWSNGSFQTGQMTRSTHCVFSKVESQIKDKLWFHLSGLPETCVMNTSWDLSLDFERPAITGHSHYSLIWQKGCLSTNPSKSTDISKIYF